MLFQKSFRKDLKVPASSPEGPPRVFLRKGFQRNPMGVYFRKLYSGGPSK
jgi:hypothetical protein